MSPAVTTNKQLLAKPIQEKSEPYIKASYATMSVLPIRESEDKTWPKISVLATLQGRITS